jgi:opacity protein-like surface antigen
MRNLRPERRRIALALGLALAAIGALALACSKPEPVQPVSFHNGRLSIGISPDWVLQRDAGDSAFYRLGNANNVRLAFVDQTQDYGMPMTVVGVRSAIGSELNLAYGGVTAKLSYSGNAVLSYSREVEEGRKKIHTHNWVVARPLGYSAIARVAITLKVPSGSEYSPEILALVESLDRQVGDATMPEA